MLKPINVICLIILPCQQR